MGRKPKFDSDLKAKIALEAIREQKTLQEIAKQYNVAPKVVEELKNELLANAGAVFEKPGGEDKRVEELENKLDKAYKALGQATVERDFFAGACDHAFRKKRG